MIPAFVNDEAGTAHAALEALGEAGGFDVHEVPPRELGDVIDRELRQHPRRIVIAGGDGTVCTAATATRDSDVELAVLPGGTLNHFARDHGIPTDLGEAARVALNGRAVTADVGYVGDRLFLNTSSVGAYVTYVRLRERLERYCGYRLASLLAAVRLIFAFRPVTVELEVDGTTKRYSTPLVFIGVGERELSSPHFGSRIPGGKHALHVLVVRERRAPRLLLLALDAVRSGLREVARTPELDSYLVDSCSVDLAQRRVARLAVDGEIVELATPLRFRLAPGALRIVVPDAGSSDAGTSDAGSSDANSD